MARHRSATFAAIALIIMVGCAEEPEPEPRRVPTVRYTPPPAPAPAPAPVAAPQPAQSSTVYVAPDSGECFHSTPGCRGLQRARSVQPVSRDQAAARGLRPCRICNP